MQSKSQPQEARIKTSQWYKVTPSNREDFEDGGGACGLWTGFMTAAKVEWFG
jgi:hypothetical protein